jgi:hypothetical protein
MNFFPCTLLFLILALLTLTSYLIDKQTKYILLGLLFSLTTQTLSSLLIIFYASCVYDYEGLYQIKALYIGHIIFLAVQLFVNLVMRQFFVKIFINDSSSDENDDKEGYAAELQRLMQWSKDKKAWYKCV